jgi:ABC-type nitrate/sulfonate/bicarbonate transport system permease component
MNLRDLSYTIRNATVARAAEDLLASLERSHRRCVAPILLGVVLGVGIGALVFQEEARKRALQWMGPTIVRSPSANGATAEPRDAARA